MGALKDNIDHYMKLKGKKKYSDLLRDIAKELGIPRGEVYEFARKEKSNFSKMLKDERPLKYEFIIPLEKIFGVSLARLLEEEAYKLPVEKENVPFIKGFRYYAYLDDPKLYREEFDRLLAKDGKSILTKPDEFGKYFLDYVVEYHAVNGVRYLYDEYGITLKWQFNEFEFQNDSGTAWVAFDNYVEFARLVASMNDTELFNNIFDSYNMFVALGHYGREKAVSIQSGCEGEYERHESIIFCQSDYLEIVLDNEGLFQSIFKKRMYEYFPRTRGKKGEKADPVTYCLINPIVNNCLQQALKDLKKYRKQAIEILEFGIKHNKKIEVEGDGYTFYNECGALIQHEKIIDIVVCAVGEAGDEIEDNEIKALIEQLRQSKERFRKMGGNIWD